MIEWVANFCLVFLAISLLVTYTAVRLNWLNWQIAGISGYLSSAVFLFLFALLKQNTAFSSFILGFGLGLLFTMIAVIMGMFFRVSRQA